MRTGHGFALASFTGGIALILACGGKTSGTGPGASSSSGGAAAQSACDDYFGAAYEHHCVLLPSSEITRLQSRFDTACLADLALPGISLTPTAIEACVSAVESEGCAPFDDDTSACNFGSGTLPPGSTCVSDEQCTDGDCSAGSLAPDGSEVVCGTCATSAAIGAQCGNGVSCGPGAGCEPDSTGTYTCVAITNGGAGASCAGTGAQCAKGLYCNPAGQCAPPGGMGTPCTESPSCTPPLVCPPAPTGRGTCQSPGAAGAPCAEDLDCGSGLGCSVTAEQCATVTFAAAGQPCGDTNRCIVGECQTATGQAASTCPTVIPDGQPCTLTDPTTTCDSFATCTRGTCTLGGQACP